MWNKKLLLKERLSQCWTRAKGYSVMLGITWFLLPVVVLCVIFVTPWGINIMSMPPICYPDCVDSLFRTYPYLYIIFIPLLVFDFLWVKRVQRKLNIYLFCAYIALIVFTCEASWVRFLSCDPTCWEWTLLVFLVALLLLELFRMIRTICVYNKKAKCDDDVSEGFCVQTNEKNLIDVGWKNYAEVLVQQMLATKLDRENFAIGVVGSWGSGKTTFMETLKKEMGDNFIVINFIPWHSSSPETLIRNFFDCLRSELCENSVDVKFSRYVELLQNIDSSGIIRMLGQLAVGNNSLEHEKKKIESKLSLLRRKVVIFIDDTDRMKGEELMGMLKIIRLSANFKNVFFVVAYDKSYMLEQMKAIGIDNGVGYLKKIFPLEIDLPFVEKDVLSEMFKQEMDAYTFDEDFVSEVLNQIAVEASNGNALVSKYIKNFRDVKIFMNTLVVGLNLLIKMDDIFSYKDFFWIEIIRMYLPELYSILSNEPLGLLDIDQSLTNDGGVYLYTALADLRAKQSEGKKQRKTALIDRYGMDSEQILLILFGKENVEYNSIKMRNNYFKYFEYRLPTNVISKLEFDYLLDAGNESEVRRLVSDYWCEGKLISLYHHLTHYNLRKCGEERQARNFVLCVIETVDYFEQTSIQKLFRSCLALNASEFVKEPFVERMIKYKLSSLQDKFERWNSLLASIYTKKQYDEEGEKFLYISVLSDNQIENLMAINFNYYINAFYPPPPIQEITRRDSALNIFVKNSCVNYEVYPNEGESLRKCLIFDALVAYFSKNKASNNKNAFVAPLAIDKSDPNYDNFSEYVSREKVLLFGNEEKYDEFVNKCFD